MSNFSWRSALLNQTSYTVKSGEHQLNLRRCYRHKDGIPVLMVAGAQECGDIFWPEAAEAGLAPFLADCGFDVFVADLRGKGISWPSVSRNSDWGLRALITEDIPAHLAKIAKLRPATPQFWVGHGMGSLLLSGCYARLDILPAPVMGMVHFAAARRCELSNLLKSMNYARWQSQLSLTSILFGGSSVTLPNSDSRQVMRELSQWHSSAEWIEQEDSFSYREGLRQKGMPPSIYYALAGRGLWGNVADTRLWMRELGNHDAQLLSLGQANGNLRNYDQHSMLTHKDACDDHFVHLYVWMQNLIKSTKVQSLAQA